MRGLAAQGGGAALNLATGNDCIVPVQGPAGKRPFPMLLKAVLRNEALHGVQIRMPVVRERTVLTSTGIDVQAAPCRGVTEVQRSAIRTRTRLEKGTTSRLCLVRGHGKATPSDGMATPSDDMATLSDGMATLSDGMVTPSGDMATPRDGMATPSDDMATPSQEE